MASPTFPMPLPPASPSPLAATLEILVAGGVSGLVAETLLHPFDTISHRAKVHPSAQYGSVLGAAGLIWRQEGLRGFFAGLRATLAQGPPSTAAYFLTYESAKSAGLRATGGRHADAVYFCAGAASELFASLLFVPLEVVKSRMQLGADPRRATGGVVAARTNFRTVREALAGIYAERGLAGLTAGWQAGFVQDVVFSATQFLVYENLRQAAVARRRRMARDAGAAPSAQDALESAAGPASTADVTTAETLLCGCIAGGLAAAITNPFDVVTSRIMVQDGHSAGYAATAGGAGNGGGAAGGMSGVLAAAMRDRGVLWRGTLPRVAQVAPLSAVAFAVYEFMRSWLADTSLFRDAALAENPFAR